MEKINLPFLIGEGYEKWEFELDVLPDKIKGFDSYRFIGKNLNKYLNYLPDEVELIFNLDILEMVILKFENKEVQFFEDITNKTNKFDFTEVEVKCHYLNNSVFIIYGKMKLLNKLVLDSLLR